MKGKGLGLCTVLGALFAMLLAWSMPASAYAATLTVGGAQGFGSLDEAVAAAQSDDTIEISGDCSSTGINASDKSLTIVGNAESRPTITFIDKGIYASSSDIEFVNCNVVMTVSDNPSGSGGTANLFSNSDLTLTNSSLSLTNDDSDAGGESGLYLYQDSNLYLNGSTMTVAGFNDANESSGIFCDSSEYEGMPNRSIELRSQSTLTVTNCGWHGMTVNPVDITVDDHSTLSLSGNGNQEYGGGLGCYYGKLTVSNSSSVVASDNPGTGWGIFIRDLVVDGTSSLQASNNGGDGIDVGGTGVFESGAKAEFNGNASTGLRVYMSGSWVGEVTIEGKANVTANNNADYGIRNNNLFTVKSGAIVTTNDNGLSGFGVNQATAKTTVETDANVTILRNRDGGVFNAGTLEMQSGTIMLNTTTLGGGLYNTGTATLGPDVAIYNNHASRSGDDIFNRDSNASVTFGTVGSGWALDGAPDCADPITGWYDDSEGARWAAHSADYSGIHVVEQEVNGTVTLNGLHALKAAHGLGSVAVDPADITVYMGGDQGYEGVITDEDDGSYDASNSLPEPGFYFVLPDEINQAFDDAGIAEVGEAANLSNYMTIYTHGYSGSTGELHWRLEEYGKTNSSAYGQFIYRIVPDPTPGQEPVPVRLQFTSEDGSTTFTNDTFDPAQAGALHQQYTMRLYTELVDANQVVFEVNINGTKYYNTMELQEGVLDVRYVTDDQDDVVTDVVNSEEELAAARANNPDKAYAVMPDGTTYYINESKVDVTDSAAPSLLFDDLAGSDDTGVAADHPQQLANRAFDVITEAGASMEHPWYQAKYLDLVDANNGNVYLTTDQPVTVYWPYPAGTDQNTEFHLVHFADLDRDMNNGEISGQIDSSAANYVAVENTEHGIRFTTDGFSPFVLMWEGEGDGPAEPPVNAEPPASGTLTATGDNSLTAITVLGTAGGTCIAAAYVLRKRKAQ